MANMVTYATLLADCRTRADMVNNNFCTDAEVLQFIIRSYGRFYAMVVGKVESDYFVQEGSISVVADTATYALDVGFYKLLGVDVQDGSEHYPLKKFQRRGHNRRQSYSSGKDLQYRLRTNTLWLVPTPKSAETLRYYFIPLPTRYTNATTLDSTLGTPISATTDLYDFFGPGWEEYVIIDVAIKMKVKEESSTKELRVDKAVIMSEIQEELDHRDAGEPERVIDVDEDRIWDGDLYYDTEYSYF